MGGGDSRRMYFLVLLNFKVTCCWDFDNGATGKPPFANVTQKAGSTALETYVLVFEWLGAILRYSDHRGKGE
jgi:hypothetical protein